MATNALATMNRGQMLAMLGAERRDDGSYKLKAACPECGAESCRIEWAKSAGIEGRIFHDDDGCELSTADAVTARLPEPPPDAEPQATEPAPVVPIKAATEPGIDYVRFNFPVSCGQDELQSWSRTKHGHIKLEIQFPWMLLSWKNQVRRIPMTNVAYIAERVP